MWFSLNAMEIIIIDNDYHSKCRIVNLKLLKQNHFSVFPCRTISGERINFQQRECEQGCPLLLQILWQNVQASHTLQTTWKKALRSLSFCMPEMWQEILSFWSLKIPWKNAHERQWELLEKRFPTAHWSNTLNENNNHWSNRLMVPKTSGIAVKSSWIVQAFCCRTS